LFEVLRSCGALVRLLPELDRLWGVPQRADYHPEVDTGVHAMMVLDMAARLQAPLTVRFACLGHDLGKGTTPADVLPRHLGHEGRSAKLVAELVRRWRVPRDCAELADVVAMEHGNIHRSLDLAPAATLRLLQRCDALRRPERFAEALLACECDARGRLGLHDTPYPQAERLQQALCAALAVDAGAVAQGASATGAKGPQIARAVDAERERAIAALSTTG
jgi:tRNA nucleotidyltransferase (CCA-adding enzyme)